MNWNARERQKPPKQATTPADFEDVAHTSNPNVHPIAFGMGVVDFPSRWRTEALHRIVGGAEKNGAQDVDQNVKPAGPVSDRLAASIERRAHPIDQRGFVTGGSPDKKDRVQHQHDEGCPSRHQHAESPSFV